MRARDSLLPTAALLLAACSPAGPTPSPYGSGSLSGVTLSESGGSEQSGDGDGDTGDGDPGDGDGDPGDTGPKLDTLPAEGTADDGIMSDGCDKVDFLFVIDNSISMGDEQQNLEASFPEFIATIQSDVVNDYHVMVVDTDNEDKWDEELAECHDSKCDGEPPDEICGIIPPQTEWPCGMLPAIDPCDPVLGAGIDHDGTDQRNSCNIAGGKRWFDDMQPNVASTFSCIANEYAGNNPEQTMLAVTTALQPPLINPGGCNDGFLRDDAILVVTFISDEEDDTESPGNPMLWHDTLLGLKQGNETAIVVLGLLGDTGLPNAICPPDSVPGSNGGEYSPRLIEYVDSWGTRGLWGSVCSPNYGPFFEQAVALIDSACEEYEPVG